MPSSSGRTAVIALGCAGMVGAGLLLGSTVDDGDQPPPMPPSTVAFSEPPRITGDGRTLTTALRPVKGPTVAGGRTVIGRTYGGQFVGPTLVLPTPGHLELFLDNDLADHTNLHYHGFHVSPRPPSDQVITTMVMPGETFRYEVDIPKGHAPGTYWYHSHAHGLSEGQVFGGMSGAVIIGTQPFPGYTDRLFALKDFQVDKNNTIPSTGIDSNLKTTRTVNGLLQPYLVERTGDIEFWRLANIGADIFYDVTLVDAHNNPTPFQVVGEDGNPVTTRWSATDLVMPPGKRFDVYVPMGPPGTYQLRTLKYSTGSAGDTYPDELLATVYVDDQAAHPAPLPSRAPGHETIPPATYALTKILTEDANGFYINGKKFDPDVVNDAVPLGSVEDWTITNETDEQHPFHIHQNDFWVIKENGKPHTPTGRQDTVIVPPRESVTVRIPFQDYTGAFVYHCHILAHEDGGMMAVVNVVHPTQPRR